MGMFGGGPVQFGGGMPGGPGVFDKTFKCFPSSFFAATKAASDPETYESADKILLPPSALSLLAQLHIEYPMLFELIPHNGGKKLHCGVLEFVADEGQCFVPFWMMENMQLEEGDLLTIRNASLEKGTYVKFRPQSKSFVELANPRAVLERTLAKYACLTQGETIRIFYNDKTYDIDVVELKSARGPDNAVTIIEADLNVDFDTPADYVEPSQQIAPTEVFVPDTEFSKAAAGGCIAVPKGFHLDDDSVVVDEGRSVGGKSKKKKKKAVSNMVFRGQLTPGPLVAPEGMRIGEYAPEGASIPFGYSFSSKLATTSEPAFQGAAKTLRATKGKP